ncbi:hypothetical protein [Paenibacillus polysaccharolyticus]|uniref:hypothetical protein n=1 Tax=Paenibacillus polysaccharolyticus TaxID=582692 RepID=UPI0030085FA7
MAEVKLRERLNALNAFSRRISIARAGTSVASVRGVIAAGSVAAFAFLCVSQVAALHRLV